jgi:hypothetical protein
LANVEISYDDSKGKQYFEGSMAFMATLAKVLNMLTVRVKYLAVEEFSKANVSQIWGVVLLLFVMILSPILVILAKNAISSIQVQVKLLVGWSGASSATTT